MKTNRFIPIAALAGAFMTAAAPAAVAQNHAPTETTTAQMADTSRLSVVQTRPMQFRVLFNKPQSPKIAVRILDSTGKILFNETKAVQSGYMRYFDLSPLQDGTYTFEIVDGQEKYNQSFDILTQTRRIVSSIR
jgi:hypothetical protein